MTQSSGLRIGYQGEQGCYSSMACADIFIEGANTTCDLPTITGYQTFSDVHDALSNGHIDFAVLPIENTLGGTLHENYDAISRYNFIIRGEYKLKVDHCLLANRNASLEDIRYIISHRQALAQCRGFIKNLNTVPITFPDTAGAARLVHEIQEDKRDESLKGYNDLTKDNVGALAPSVCLTLFSDLKIIQNGVQDYDSNYTRFLIISQAPEDNVLDSVKIATNEDVKGWKVTITFWVPHEVGSLMAGMQCFSLHKINMSKIESRPVPAAHLNTFFENTVNVKKLHEFEYIFYIDLEVNGNLVYIRNAIDGLRNIAPMIRVLGFYPAHYMDDPASQITLKYFLTDIHKGLLYGVKQDGIGPPPGLRIGIIGFGTFGQFLCQSFSRDHVVFATSRGDYEKKAKEIGADAYIPNLDLEQLLRNNLDVVVICVSILSFKTVVIELSKLDLSHILVVDVLSVKSFPKQTMLEAFNSDVEILCTHPMFGPDSGKDSWRNLPFIYENVRIEKLNEVANGIVNIFKQRGCRILEMECEEHDHLTASSQFMTHLTGRVLSKQGLKGVAVATQGFEKLLEVMDNTTNDSFDLFLGLYCFNKNADLQLQKFKRTIKDIDIALRRARKRIETDNASSFAMSKFARSIEGSSTAKFFAKVTELKEAGKDIISLVVGQPDFKPPVKVIEATKMAADRGVTGYTVIEGTLELRQAISNDIMRRKKTRYNPQNEIIVTSGAKQAISSVCFVMCEKGDEVLLPTPTWTTYKEDIRMTGAKVVEVPSTDGYQLNVELMETLMNENTKLIILCNPNNPTSVVFTKEKLKQLAALLRRPAFKHIFILGDEIYERMVYEDVEYYSLMDEKDLIDRYFYVSGVSKSYALCGYRIGLCAGRSMYIEAMKKLQSQTTGPPCAITQAAAVTAYAETDDEYFKIHVQVLKQKSKIVAAALSQIDDVTFVAPECGFFTVLDISKLLHKTFKNRKIMSSTNFVNELLIQSGVAVIPGDDFGAPNTIRISFALDLETLNTAMKLLVEFCQSLV